MTNQKLVLEPMLYRVWMYLFAQQVTVTTSANAIRLRQGSADLLDDIQRHIDGEVDEG